MKMIEVNREEFDKRLGNVARIEGLAPIVEKAWFVTESGNLGGIIAFDQVDKNWSFVVLGRDQTGIFRGIDLQVDLESIGKAQTALFRSMTEHGEQEVFPQ
jgi:hypothetical protein